MKGAIVLVTTLTLALGCAHLCGSMDILDYTSSVPANALKVSESSLDMGHLFKMHRVSYIETLTGVSNKLSKMVYKMTAFSSYSRDPNIPLIATKGTLVEDLLNCNSLSDSKDLECLPLAQHVPDAYKRARIKLSSPNALHVHRYSMKIKHIHSDRISKWGLEMLPLRDEMVKIRMEALLKEQNVNFDFKASAQNVAYQFKVHAMAGTPAEFHCSGDALLSFNITDDFLSEHMDVNDHQAHLDMATDVFKMSEDGFMFILDQMRCSPKAMPLLSFIVDFFIVSKPTFPYLTVRHDMYISPISALYQYSATVDQIKVDRYETAYDTKVRIDSSSTFLPFLDFKLNQTFENDDSTTGREAAELISKHFTATVGSEWNKKNFMKQLNIFFEENIAFGDKPALAARYQDTSDFVEITFKIPKNNPPSSSSPKPTEQQQQSTASHDEL